MREYGIEYNMNGRAVYEIFAVCSLTVLCFEIDCIKAKGGQNVKVNIL